MRGLDVSEYIGMIFFREMYAKSRDFERYGISS